MNLKPFLYSLLIGIAIGCTDSKKKESGLTGYYHDYLVALGENQIHKVQCVVTFLKDNEDGKPQELPEGFAVYLDSTRLPLNKDVYPNYGVEIDRNGFTGAHQWILKKGNSVAILIPFDFRTFTTSTTIGPEIGKTDIPVAIEGLQEEDIVECWFDNIDIDNEKDRFEYPVKNKTFTIRVADMRSLKAGAYKLKISYIKKSPVEIFSKKTGKLDISYSLNDIPVAVMY